MLRITEVGVGTESTTLRVEGRVAGPGVGELRKVAEAFLNGSRRIRLDLSEVTFVDAKGADLLRELMERQVEVQGRSSFAAELLGGGEREEERKRS